MNAIRLGALVILLAGVSLTARAAYVRVKGELAGLLVRQAWEESVRSGETCKPWPWADTHPIARLEIPRIGYDEIVLDSATPRALAFGPALLESGANPGRSGNVVLAGHRTSWFLPLENVAPGDTLRLQWFDARHGALYERTYKIDFIRVVQPGQTSLLAPTEEDLLTLITCYPFGRSPNSPQRYIVRALPTSASQPANRVRPEQAALDGLVRSGR